MSDPSAPAAGDPAEWAAQARDAALLAATPPPLPMTALPQPSVQERAFSTHRAADVVRLSVDGQVYRCRPTAPADPITDALSAQQSGNHGALLQAVRNLIGAVMYDEDRARYKCRTNATDLRPYAFAGDGKAVGTIADLTEERIRHDAGSGPNPAEDPEGSAAFLADVDARVAAALDAIPELDPIDPFALIEHGLWLVEVYLDKRPTVRPAPSGDGSAVTTSTPGALPTA